MPVRIIDPGGKYGYELAAEVLALMVWPDEPLDVQEKARRMLCGWFVRVLKQRADASGADVERLIRSDYALLNQAMVQECMDETAGKLEQRLVAGHIAIAFMQDAGDEPPVGSPENLGPRTVENVIAFVAAQQGIHEDNLRKRIWRPSWKVVHLAAAWAVKIQESQIRTGSAPDIFDLMANHENLLALLAEAERYEALVDRSRSLTKASKLLERIRFVRQGSAGW